MPPLKAGTYKFECSIHPALMNGELVAGPLTWPETPVRGPPAAVPPADRRSPLLVVAVVATIAIVALVALTRPATTGVRADREGQPVPEIAGTTLDGAPVRPRGAPRPAGRRQLLGPRLRALPDGVPAAEVEARAARRRRARRRRRPHGRPGRPAREFIADQGATWPTVSDPNGAIKQDYRVVARPQSYFIDRDGILRSIQIGEAWPTPTSSGSTT